MAIRIETQDIAADGGTMRIHVARPEKSNAPGIMVLPEIFGVNAHMREVAERFATMGYVAVVPELFHRTAPAGFVSEDYNFAQVEPHYKTLTEVMLAADLRATYDWLAADAQTDATKIAAAGFCLGGRAAFLANGILPLACAVSFYGTGIAQHLLHLAPQQNGPILLGWGGKDAGIGPANQRAVTDALRAAEKVFVEIEFSNAPHAFTNSDRPSNYNPSATRQAWGLIENFLGIYLG